MDNNYTHITLLLDESSSMQDCYEETIQSIDNFIAEQKKLNGKCTFSLTTFSTRVKHHLKVLNLQEIETIKYYYHVGGWTALYDALGETIIRTGEIFSEMEEQNRPGRVLFVIVTDGEENSSCYFRKENLHQMITEQQEKYSWDFVFLGVDFDAFNGYGGLGVNSKNYASFSKDDMVGNWRNFCGNVSTYRSVDNKGSVNLTENIGENNGSA